MVVVHHGVGGMKRRGENRMAEALIASEGLDGVVRQESTARLADECLMKSRLPGLQTGQCKPRRDDARS